MPFESPSNNQERNWPVIGGIIISLLFLGATLAPFLFVPLESNSWLQNLGNVGQLVSGLFAPLAFVWVVVAVILQSRELKLQREELMLTREELKSTREVFEHQKEEMKRSADETREQTRIMNDNLRRESERQIYSEADILLYSLALYTASNKDKPAVEGFGSIMRVHGNLVANLNKDNSDGIFPVVRNGLENFLRYTGGQPCMLNPDGGPVLDYFRDQIALLCENEKFSTNTLVATRIESLCLKQILGLLRSIKAN